jgi:multidrug transporter EmrE-like cation transporter
MPEQLLALLVQPAFYTACMLYAAATVLWVWLLTLIPLSAAYPFAALSFVIVPVASWWFLGEPLGGRYWAGIGLIVAGVSVIASVTAPNGWDPPASAFSDSRWGIVGMSGISRNGEKGIVPVQNSGIRVSELATDNNFFEVGYLLDPDVAK